MSDRRFTDKPALNPQAVRSLAPDHPAMVENRTLFPSTVVTVTKTEPARLLVSGRENRKLGAVVEKGAFKGYGLYGLSLEERATCPASCEARGYCYGNGMQLARRHRIADADVFFDRLGFELVELCDEHPGVLVRLHVLGDFPSTDYAGFWKDALAENSKLACYGYTHHAPGSEIGRAIAAVKDEYRHRFRIRWSGALSQPDGAVIINETPKAARHAMGLVCPAQTDASACCATCALCWDISFARDCIAFIKHGPKSGEAEAAHAMAALRAEAPPAATVIAAPESGIKPAPPRIKEVVSPIKEAPARINAPRAATAPGPLPKGLRRCGPLALNHIARAASAGERPRLLWAPPGDLIVEEKYQRDLSAKSLALIRKIVTGFDWAKFKPPVVAETDAGLLVIDGQHSAIAAATHGGIAEIPVLVVGAEHLEQRASAFAAHNRDRIAMTTLQIFHAEVAAGDQKAFQLLKLVIEAGGEIPRNPPRKGDAKPGQFLVIRELHVCFNEGGADWMLPILRICVQSNQKPVPRVLMRALRLIYSEDAFAAVAALPEAALAKAAASIPGIDAAARRLAAESVQKADRACALLIARAAGVGFDHNAPASEAA